MLNVYKETDLTTAQPPLNEWLVRCGIFSSEEQAAGACADLETLTVHRRKRLDDLKQGGKLVALGLVELELQDGETDSLVEITPAGLGLYGACQAWLVVYRKNKKEDA